MDNPNEETSAELAAATARAITGGDSSSTSTSAGATGKVKPGSVQVYMGQTPRKNTALGIMKSAQDSLTEHADKTPLFGNEDNILSWDDAIGEFYRWTDAERDKWKHQLIDLGFKESDLTASKLRDLWVTATQEAGNYYTLGGKNVTPFDAAKILWEGESDSAKTARGNGFTGTKAYNSTSSNSNTTLTNQSDARALVLDVFQRMLGRNATDDEVKQLTVHLNDAEKANPQYSHSSTDVSSTYLDGDLTNQVSNTTSSNGGGLNQRQTLEDEIIQMPEYGAFQAATTYMGYLRDMLGGLTH